MSAAIPPQFLGRVSRKRAVLRALLVVDAVALLIATLGATWIRFSTLQAGAGIENIDVDISYWEVSLYVTLLWLLMLWREGLYDLERLTWGAEEYSRVLRALGAGVVGFILLTYALKTPGLSRAWTLIAFGLDAYHGGGLARPRLLSADARR